MRSKPRSRGVPSSAPSAPAAPPNPPSPPPAWLRPAVFLCAVALLLCWFSSDVSDSDTWWHLKTGQYILQNHKLPVPDPFAFTTDLFKDSYPGESVTRYFNLTHEWLAQVILAGVFNTTGYTGLVLLRAVWLALFCSLSGLLVYRRTGRLYGGLAAAIGTGIIASGFAGDRPQYLTYVFLAVTVLLLDERKWLWLLPPMFLIWANCHAGFFLGWVVVGIYAAESLYLRWRQKPVLRELQLWGFGIGAMLLSGLNPNGFRVLQVMRSYRNSPMQSRIWEWQYPQFWEFAPFTLILYGALLILLLNRRKVRPVDWLLLLAFGASGLLALRNIIFVGFIGSFLIATYFPEWRENLNWKDWVPVAVLGAVALVSCFYQPILALLAGGAAYLVWRYGRTTIAEVAVAIALLAGCGKAVAAGRVFQFRPTDNVPADAADFLIQHHIKGRLFNTYGQGGYLLWRLYPQMQVFIDGRALSERVFNDAARIGMNADETGGRSGEQLLKDYGIDVIMMDGFESVSGTANYLPAALADPKQTEWKLVFRDVHDIIYMRNPPPDVTVLNSIDALATMEEQCQYLVDHDSPACTQGMIDVFQRVGDRARVQKWYNIYRDAHVQLTFTKF